MAFFLSYSDIVASCHQYREQEFGATLDVNRLPLDGEGGLIELLQGIPDPRKRRGIRHRVETILAIAICAALSRGRSFCAIYEWALSASPDLLRKLGAKHKDPPSEPTIRNSPPSPALPWDWPTGTGGPSFARPGTRP